MPDMFIATVTEMERDVKRGQFAGAPLLKLSLALESGETFTTSYRIPKAWTGKGQMDIFMEHLKNLGVKLSEIEGKQFQWKREPLIGSIQGNPRHYPIRLVKTGKMKP